MTYFGFDLPVKFSVGKNTKCYVYSDYTIIESSGVQKNYTAVKSNSENPENTLCDDENNVKTIIKEAPDSHLIGFFSPYLVVAKNKIYGIEEFYFYDIETSVPALVDFMTTFHLTEFDGRKSIEYKTVFGRRFRPEIKCDVCGKNGKACVMEIYRKFKLEGLYAVCPTYCIEDADPQGDLVISSYINILDLKKPGERTMLKDYIDCQ